MKRIIHSIILCFCSLSLFIGCTSNPNDQELTPIPTVTRIPTPTLLPLETLVAAPEYMRGCLALNPKKLEKQVGYLNIYPGVTPPEDIETLAGKANLIKITHAEKDYQTYIYYKFDIYVDIQTDSIEKIHLSKNENFPMLMEIIQLYGCPDVIFAVNNSDDIPDYFRRTDFIYNIYGGIKFIFNDYPIDLNSKPYSIWHFSPGLVDSIYMDSGFAKPVSWDEAIR